MTDETQAASAPPSFQTPPPTPIGLTPYLTIRGGRGVEALTFYAAAFGAKELFRNFGPDGKRLIHARFQVNGAVVFMSDDFPDMRGGAEAPPAAGVTLHLQVDDADAWAARAAKAGAEVTMPVQEMFWGDRYGQLRDPFGHSWSLGSAKR
jgi:PhnB protein